jgi:hypothetical protein
MRSLYPALELVLYGTPFPLRHCEMEADCDGVEVADEVRVVVLVLTVLEGLLPQVPKAGLQPVPQ